jgi:hypothetical protein
MEPRAEFHAIDVDALTLQAPLAALQWWRAKLAAHGAVRRDEVEPLLEIPRLLAHAMLFAREEAGWFVRVVGTELDRQLGRKLAGLAVAAALPDMSPSLLALLDHATAVRTPAAAAGVVLRIEPGEKLSWQAVLLPLEHRIPRVLAVLGWTIELLDEPLEPEMSNG